MANLTSRLICLLLSLFLYFENNAWAQTPELELMSEAIGGLTFRNIGPAVMGGRIADIAVNPEDRSQWYVAVGSGGLWKTTNQGITWKPVFDNQPSYSIGSVTIDPKNTQVVWVGTGENVSGRHVGWGSGVYRSADAGATWEHMGLPKSDHIGRILVDPRNSDVVLVAAEGPLWSSGGERGLYKTEDGGKTWKQTLQIDENTGVTDVEFDPSNPDILYAAAYQRRRHTWSFLAGGPQSGIYKSTDNGDTWKKITNGLPHGEIGKIGLAVTPANPQIVYATIEADDENKGLYQSTDKGERWEKRSSYISGGTGPHYYQEIEVSPTNADLIYQMDVFIHVSRDGGKSFDFLGTGREKHSDNHALWIDPENEHHLLAGTDGGLYETFDEGTTWRHFPNLPISQFYKIDLDRSEPFYDIVAGAQDLGTLIGPSRTTNVEGVRNQDWYVPLGADGYDAAFDPEDPNTVYLEIQQGLLYRLNRQTQEVLNIQPQPDPGDPPERFNWDSPILISPHHHETLYFGSQRLWRSQDRGDSWEPISGDLTANHNRYELMMIDRVPSVDALYDNGAMSQFSSLTSIAESPLAEGLLYTGSDDGLIHVSEDKGQNWRASQTLPEVPELAFINDIEASPHDPNTVFASADAHKLGDYSPYLFISDDRGRSWKSIVGDLPDSTIVWVIKQDHADENMLFIGTEYGLYFSPNQGSNWLKLNAGVPTIPFRDLELHQLNNDLVGGSFGRGIYVLDDYSPLREMNRLITEDANFIFPVRDAWWYIPNVPMQAKGMPTSGSTNFTGDNPPFGAVFTYYLHDLPQTAKSVRREKESDMEEQGGNIPFPTWDTLTIENKEDEPKVLLLVQDENENPLRWLEGESKEGLRRLSWDLRLPPPNPIILNEPAFKPPWAESPQGPLVAPGKYQVALYVVDNGDLQRQGDAQEFTIKPLPRATGDANFQVATAFQRETSDLYRRITGANRKLGEADEKLKYIQATVLETSNAAPELFSKLKELHDQLADLHATLAGDPVRQRLNVSSEPSITERVANVIYGHWNTSQPPTKTHRRNIEIAESSFDNFLNGLEDFFGELAEYENTLEEAGAPWTPGREIK